MSDTEYFAIRAGQELRAATCASDQRVRDVHLELADAYSFRIRELHALARRGEMRLVSRA